MVSSIGSGTFYQNGLGEAAVAPCLDHFVFFFADTALKGQDGDRERVWVGVEGALAPNTSSLFPPEPPGASSNIIPVYCALLATVVLGLLAYVAFKW